MLWLFIVQKFKPKFAPKHQNRVQWICLMKTRVSSMARRRKVCDWFSYKLIFLEYTVLPKVFKNWSINQKMNFAQNSYSDGINNLKWLWISRKLSYLLDFVTSMNVLDSHFETFPRNFSKTLLKMKWFQRYAAKTIQRLHKKPVTIKIFRLRFFRHLN